jgi:LytR cell envelope-related transcriptional attenuator
VRPDQRGVALSSPLALLSAAAVLLAGAAFVATDGSSDDATARAPTPAAASPSARVTSPASEPATRKAAHERVEKRVVHRGETYVEVFNNSGISGLAGSTAARAQGAGWQVVGSDNWFGTIPATTVYYPAGLHEAGRLLGRDLGISRVKPTIAPMRGDRLTVLLTGDHS